MVFFDAADKEVKVGVGSIQHYNKINMGMVCWCFSTYLITENVDFTYLMHKNIN